MILTCTQPLQGQQWLERYRGRPPLFACILGFTATGLVPGISAAGATPHDRQYTAIADAEFLINGPQPQPRYPLPPLHVGASPVLISHTVVTQQQVPVGLFNAGLPIAPSVPCIDLAGAPAQCLGTGSALPLATVEHLFEQGLIWGEQLAAQVPDSYVILGECVVGGTTTALAVLTGLRIAAHGKVNSSHPVCNHRQKWHLVQAGLLQGGFSTSDLAGSEAQYSPFSLVAAVGDPMQITVAGMAIAASRKCGVLLAGGTQMLAVYALAQAIVQHQTQERGKTKLTWQPEQIVVGTTHWVATDSTGDTIGLAAAIGSVPLLASQLDFSNSRYTQLRAYEQGYVKEGVGAGGCAIAAHLYQGWSAQQILEAVEAIALQQTQLTSTNQNSSCLC